MKHRTTCLLLFVYTFAMHPVFAQAAEINGALDLAKITAPSAPTATKGRVYIDSGTSLLACKNSDTTSCMAFLTTANALSELSGNALTARGNIGAGGVGTCPQHQFMNQSNSTGGNTGMCIPIGYGDLPAGVVITGGLYTDPSWLLFTASGGRITGFVSATLPQFTPTSTDPVCSVNGDIGKIWLNNTSAVTTHFSVCAAVASSPAWVQIF